jgi:hypothetical protein
MSTGFSQTIMQGSMGNTEPEDPSDGLGRQMGGYKA